MKFQGFSIQILIISVLGIILLATGLTTTSAYAFVRITSPFKGQHVPVGDILEYPHLIQLTIAPFQSLLTV